MNPNTILQTFEMKNNNKSDCEIKNVWVTVQNEKPVRVHQDRGNNVMVRTIRLSLISNFPKQMTYTPINCRNGYNNIVTTTTTIIVILNT